MSKSRFWVFWATLLVLQLVIQVVPFGEVLTGPTEIVIDGEAWPVPQEVVTLYWWDVWMSNPAAAGLGLVTVFLLVAALASEVRRFHDVGSSGWWVLIAFVPVAGPFIVLYLLAQPGDIRNEYGEPVE